MRKAQLLAILFFSAIWGLSEAVLGDALYAARTPLASVYLTVIAFLVLALASPFIPRRGGATAMGILAMLYKFLNVPFFGCHLVGIALLGVSWDIVFGLADRLRSAIEPGPRTTAGFDASSTPSPAGPGSRVWLRPAILAAVACYLGHTLFTIAMVFVFRSPHWIEQGLAGGLRHIFVSGSLTALGCAALAPLGLRLGERLRGRLSVPAHLGLQPRMVGVFSLAVTAGLWGYGILARLLRG